MLIINPSSPKGGLQQPPKTVFAPVLRNAQPSGKISPGTSKCILSPSNLPPSRGGGG